jgi:colanic acid/amylovoran biosynthesis glycosyltransferase
VTSAIRIGYVVSRWGAPTQTFVRREAAAVGDLGAEVEAWSIKRPLGDAHWLSPREVVVGAALACVRRPLIALGLFATILRRASLRNAPAHMSAAAVGIAWSHRGTAPDFLHCHFGWVSATATWAFASMTHRPYSIVLHAFELHTRRLVDGFAPVPLRDSAGVFTISERDKRLVKERWGVDAEVLRMGVPRSWLARDHGPAGCTLISVGSLVPKKGHDVLIRAVAALPRTVELDIVGEGDERVALTGLIEELGLQQRVRLVGARSEHEVREMITQASVFVLASVESVDGDRDGIPVAIMEAMALSRPVVTTRVGAIDELVGSCGVLVAPGDVAELRDAILVVLDDLELQQDLGRRAQSEIERGWLVEESAAQLLRCASAR